MQRQNTGYTCRMATTDQESGRDSSGRFSRGNPYSWRPGQSGNPGGRPKGASFANALARQAVAPVCTREEMARIATMIGLDPEETQNIDVVAALFYTVLARLLLRATNEQGRTDERIVGMLNVLLKALDPAELRVSGTVASIGPMSDVIANVQAALGMRVDDPPELTEPELTAE